MSTSASGQRPRTGAGRHQCTDPPRPGPRSQIVVGVDGSISSIEAVRWAAHHCEVTGAHLQAVISWGSGAVEVLPDGESECEQAQDALATLRIALDHALGAQADTVQVNVTRGPPAETLLAAAVGATLLVVGAGECGSQDEAIPDSVGHFIATHSRCPVVIVRCAHLRSASAQANATCTLKSWEYTLWPGR